VLQAPYLTGARAKIRILSETLHIQASALLSGCYAALLSMRAFTLHEEEIS